MFSRVSTKFRSLAMKNFNAEKYFNKLTRHRVSPYIRERSFDLDFMSFLIVFQSYLDGRWVIMKCCVRWSSVWD